MLLMIDTFFPTNCGLICVHIRKSIRRQAMALAIARLAPMTRQGRFQHAITRTEVRFLFHVARKNPRKLTPRECARLQGFPINSLFRFRIRRHIINLVILSPYRLCEQWPS